MFNLILRQGKILDAYNHLSFVGDLAIKDGKIAALSETITEPAQDEIDCTGLNIMPGIIDTHLHVSLNPASYKAVALNGVTTCLDMMGPVTTVIKDVQARGYGLNVAGLEAIIPGRNSPDTNPSIETIDVFARDALKRGAFGLKLLGGHYPLTPQASARYFQYASENAIYAAWHCGSTQSGSNILGFEETIDLLNGRPAHICHMNGYTRGYIENTLSECSRAEKLLQAHPEVITESYISARSGASLEFNSENQPESMVVRKTLAALGYEPTRSGAYQAILDGNLGIVIENDTMGIGLIFGKEAISYFETLGRCPISFDRVNPLTPRMFFATAKRKDGTFLVDALSTDGGCIPRNVILSDGWLLTENGGLTELEFVAKTSLLPARMLQLENKGHLSIGADADITVFHPKTRQAMHTFTDGKAILRNGKLTARSGRLITTKLGESPAKEAGLNPIVVKGGIPTLNRQF